MYIDESNRKAKIGKVSIDVKDNRAINLSCQLKRKLRSQKSKHEKEKQLSDCLRS